VEQSNLRTHSRSVRDTTGYRTKAAEQDSKDLYRDEQPRLSNRPIGGVSYISGTCYERWHLDPRVCITKRPSEEVDKPVVDLRSLQVGRLCAGWLFDCASILRRVYALIRKKSSTHAIPVEP
jgi:hypothetical protein